MRLHRFASAVQWTAYRSGALTLLAALTCASAGPVSAAVEESACVAVPAAAALRTPRIAPSFGNLPVRFEPNVGQAPAGERFIVSGTGAAALTATGAVLRGGSRPVTLEFVGASASARITATGELPVACVPA